MIQVNEESLEFHLQTEASSYIFCILPNGLPGSLHYGPRLEASPSFRHLGGFSPSRYVSLMEEGVFPAGFLPESARSAWEANPSTRSLSASRVRMEYSSQGRGDYRQPSFVLRLADGTTTTRFRYAGYELRPGLPQLPGLPCLDSGEDLDAETLELRLCDPEAGLELSLFYSVLPAHDAVVRSAAVRNLGEEAVEIGSLMSLCLDLPGSDWDFLQLSGSVLRERGIERTALRPGRTSIVGTGGTSGSWWHNPFFALLSRNAGEDSGEVYAFNLLYSGDFHGGVEVDPFQTTRVLSGISPENLAWRLGPGESFHSPQALAVYGHEGLGGVSRRMHDIVRGHLIPKAWRERPRPVVFNSWEACYFDISEERLLGVAQEAAGLGAEIFVVDDGWFGHRENDLSSLGDWKPDPRRFPNGLGPLGSRLKEMGLGLGLWFEPEMVSRDSELFSSEPGLVVRTTRYEPLPSRNQLVLDFSNPATVEKAFTAIASLVEGAGLVYLKLDMNRMMSDFGSAYLGPRRQGELRHRHILGVYSLYSRLSQAFPGLLIESCASGGGRFDLGLLRWAPQAWASDNSDPVARLAIQYGSSLAYPISAMACHISPSPSHQTGRSTTVGLRGSLAVFGAFGFELDPSATSPAEREGIEAWSRFYVAHRGLMAQGDFHRLLSPYEGGGREIAWMLVARDTSEALVGAYRLLQEADPPHRRLRLRGLDPKARYSLAFSYDKSRLKPGLDPQRLKEAEDLLFCQDRLARGDELMGAGILWDDNLVFVKAGLLEGSPDFEYRLCLLKRVGE